MSNSKMTFDPKIHICKFGFAYNGMGLHNKEYDCDFTYKIHCNLYLRELSVLISELRTDKELDNIGFKLSDDKLSSLLPFIIWDDFEKMRDLPYEWYWDFANGHNGYRDGWGIKFWCMSECGLPLLQLYMSTLFKDDMLPPTEKLLKWIKTNYGAKLKNKGLLW